MNLPRLCLLLAFLFSQLVNANAKEPEKLLLAHYMPWYSTRQVSGSWGWHWTMNKFDPEHLLWDGKREVASHDYPLIGLYDSSDDAALECQVLLMKFAGLDGVVIDWYGVADYIDHAANHARTRKMIPWLKKAGLQFAICYEDKAVEQLVQGKALEAAEGVNQAAHDLAWAQEHWFGDASYVKQNGRPVLLVFGPQFLTGERWAGATKALSPQPITFGLAHLAKTPGLSGAFAWPPVSGGKTVSPEQWRSNLETLYKRPPGELPTLAGVFPGFKDIYAQAGAHESYGSIAPRLGATFAETLDLALKSESPIVQIATWNDYGEGTVIEPTHNHGYRYLELLQKRKAVKPAGPADLRLPVMLYQLRKRGTGSSEIAAQLDQAAALLFENKFIEAEAQLAKISRQLGQIPATFADTPQAKDENYRLVSEVLYREGKELNSGMHQRCRLDLYFPANKKNFPTVVWFHGGGLYSGERSIPLALRNRGIAVAAVNYRLSPEAKSPAFIEDAAAAVAWTFKNIAHYGGSPENVFVSGHSAGAYLALMVGLDGRWLSPYGIDPRRIAGLAPLSPQVITHFTIRDERGIAEKTPVVDDLAPLYHVRGDAPPMLLVTGDRERELMGRYEENAYFWRMLKLAGAKDLTFHELQGFSHGGMAEPAMPLLLKFVEAHEKRNF
jgi:acetyl esterase/lipase